MPAEQIRLGGPSRDGIPAIDRPKRVAAGRADCLNPGDRVLGLARDGKAKADPIGIMSWHEIVNDRLGGEAVAVTCRPPCGTGIVGFWFAWYAFHPDTDFFTAGR